MASEKRVKFIDMTKGMAILSIATYHLIAPGVVRTFITGIVVSLFFSFFFFSGYFYTSGKASLKQGISSRARSLLIPFFAYSIVFWLIGSVISVLDGTETVNDALCCLRNFYGGSIWNRIIQDWLGWEYHSLGRNYPFLADFWFFPALLLASIVFIVLVETIAKTAVAQTVSVIVLICVTGLLRSFSMNLPYNLQLIPFWSAIILFGYQCRQWKVFDILSGRAARFWGLAASIISIGLSVYFGYGTNMYRGTFDEPEIPVMLILFILGIMGTWGVSMLFKQLEDSGVNADQLSYFGSHSIYIYVYHVFIAWLICKITGFSMRYDPDAINGDIFAKSLLLAVVSVVITVLISVCADRLKKGKCPEMRG